MKIKTAELFCASPASTAICTTMNQHAMVRRGGGSTPRPINHHHHHHRHHNYYNNHYQFDFGDKPKFKVPTIPCTSQQHIDPKPYTSYLHNNLIKKNTLVGGKEGGGDTVARRKSSADVCDYRNNVNNINRSRYVINNPVFVDMKDEGEVCNAGALVVSEPVWPDYSDDSPKKSLSRRLRGGDSPTLVKSRSSSVRLDVAAEKTAVVESPRFKSSRSRSRDQVVELRVSIHCKGCAGKVRKHLSRMEGVTSFHIDLESKKVTVVGNVTPSSVLSSISKVKNAQLWPSPSPSSSSTSPYITIGY